MKTMKEVKSMKITESQIQISRGSREFDSVISAYHKKYGKQLQVDTMVYDKDSGKYYMYNDQTDYTLTTKRLNEGVESFEISTESVEFMKNDMKKIMSFFKGSKWLFKDAIKTGIAVYGDEVGGYRPDDKYVVIDKEHPFGTALYSSSDDELIDVLKNQLGEGVDNSDEGIFDVLGIEEENRESSKHLISQYKELQKKFPNASIWLSGDVDVYVKGKVLEKTADLSAIEESIQEGGKGSGNFKSGAQRYNDKLDKLFRAYDKQQQKFADFLISKGVSKDEVEKLKQDSGLHGNPLQQKFIELGGQIVEMKMKESVSLDLPTSVIIDLRQLIDDDIDVEAVFLDDLISDWLSDTYGFTHFGFDYDVNGDEVHVTNVQWDTEDSDLDESVKLNEGTSNFGTNKIINLCSPYQDPADFEEYKAEEREENPELTDSDLNERVYELIGIYYTDMYEQVEALLEPIEKHVKVEPGYYEGFYIDFQFDSGAELAEDVVMYNDDKEDAIEEFKTLVVKIETALSTAINEGHLVGYGVAYKFSSGETGYNLTKDLNKDLEALGGAMNKVLEQGLAYIEQYMEDEIED